MKYFVPIAFGLLALLSCNKKEEPSGTQPPVITGILYRSINGDAMGLYGDPNVYLGPNPSDPDIVVYPNPLSDVAILYIRTLQDTTAHIYILPARFDNPPPNAIVSNQSLFDPLDTVRNIRTALSGPGHSVNLDMHDLPAGFYRIYIAKGSQLYYDNLQVVH